MGLKKKTGTTYLQNMTKREFLEMCGKRLCTLCTANFLWFANRTSAQLPQKGRINRKLSPYFTTMDQKIIQCNLCPRYCQIPNGQRGYCKVRENLNGICYSLAYGNPCVIYLEKIEREAFFHVIPGSDSLTLSTSGCNFHCIFCENWEISQAFPEDVYSQQFDPEVVVEKAIQLQARSIVYTYAEPTIFYEYMADVAYEGKAKGILNLFHSNGFINPGPLRKLCKLIDAARIDLKGFTQESYQQLSDGERRPVLETLKILREEKIHLEISTLIIPTINDDTLVIKDLCQWIKKELGIDVPLHLCRFYPLYKLQRLPPTPVHTLEQARDAALDTGLQYVYIGKVPGHKAWNTYCPKCRKRVIQRIGFMIGELHLSEGKCGYCGQQIPGIWH
jgi:pyruvate formate lyase activating enzyme